MADPASLFCGVADNHRLSGWQGPPEPATPLTEETTNALASRLEDALACCNQRLLALYGLGALSGDGQPGHPSLQAIWWGHLRGGSLDAADLQLARRVSYLSDGRLRLQSEAYEVSIPNPGGHLGRLGRCVLSAQHPTQIGRHRRSLCNRWHLIWEARDTEEVLAHSSCIGYARRIGSRWLTLFQGTSSAPSTAIDNAVLSVRVRHKLRTAGPTPDTQTSHTGHRSDTNHHTDINRHARPGSFTSMRLNPGNPPVLGLNTYWYPSPSGVGTTGQELPPQFRFGATARRTSSSVRPERAARSAS